MIATGSYNEASRFSVVSTELGSKHPAFIGGQMSATEPTKLCRVCKRSLPFSELRTIKGKATTLCVKCDRERKKVWWRTVGVTQLLRDYSIVEYPDLNAPRECKGCKRILPLLEFPVLRGRRYFHCRECHYRQITQWHAAHPKRVREIKTAYRKANSEELNSKARARASTPVARETKRLSQIRRRHANPEQTRAYLAKRRKQLKVVGGHFTTADIKRLFKEQLGKCAEPTCSADLLSGYHADHILPLALGGSNDAANIQLLCRKCNMRKNAKHPLKWAQENGRLF